MNIQVSMMAHGGGGDAITWKCCNCRRDIPGPGSRRWSPADYEKEACVQCKSRPREICIQMRRATLAKNPRSQEFPPFTKPPPGWTTPQPGQSILQPGQEVE